MELEAIIDCDHTLRCLRSAGINDLEQLLLCTHEDLMAIHGIGETIAESLDKLIDEERRMAGLAPLPQGKQKKARKSGMTIDEKLGQLSMDELWALNFAAAERTPGLPTDKAVERAKRQLVKSMTVEELHAFLADRT